MSDYLFDKAGEPDPEIEQLETLLAPLAYRGRAPLPPKRPSRAIYYAALATVLASVVAIFALRPKTPRDGLATGAWIESGARAVHLTVASMGSVELAPGTRARILVANATHYELELAHGRLSAQIVAPPRSFVVRTPHAVAFDLGCAFTVEVDAHGIGRLVVTSGSVALSDGAAREVTVDAGAECAITETGPGTTIYSDVSPAFRDAIDRYPHDKRALAIILAEARTRDRRSLEILLSGAGAEELPKLERKLAELTGSVAPTPKQAAPKHEAKHAKPAAPKAKPEPPSTAKPVLGKPVPAKPVTMPKTDRGQKLQHDPFRSVD